MNKRIALGLLSVISLLISVQNPVYALDPVYIDDVRDTKGDPITAGKRYNIHVFPTDDEYSDYYITNHNEAWVNMSTNKKKADPYFISSNDGSSSIKTNGKCIYSWMYVKASPTYYQIGYIKEKGIRYVNADDGSYFGFLRIKNDQNYKYVLLCNKGILTADFKKNGITTNSSHKQFLISFEVRDY